MTELSWQPCAAIETLKQRAVVIAAIRDFFAERDVLEVETPLLARYSVTDPHMSAISADNPGAADDGQRHFLQTSPEYAMKRLLAAGSGPVFQICKAFRRGEQSRRHNPEFSMLEWYRPGFSMHQLMDEIDALLQTVLELSTPAQRISYRQVFIDFLQIDPMRANCAELEKKARQHLQVHMRSDDKDDWLNLMIAELIEPKLAELGAVFIHHYPVSQAALARIETDEDGIDAGCRFELYIGGLEIANGYDELTDVAEQRRRFEMEQQQRMTMAKTVHDADAFLLAALDAGLPPCSGVALGLDRLVMLALKQTEIADVLAFPVDRA